MHFVQNVTTTKHTTKRDKPEVQIKQQQYFILVLSVNINGIKIEFKEDY
jgi:hypothetical protein